MNQAQLSDISRDAYRQEIAINKETRKKIPPYE